MIVEPVEIVLTGFPVERPGRRLLAGKDDPLRVILRARVRPYVPVAIKRVLIQSRVLKPRARIGRVIYHQVHDHPDAQRLCAIHELDEVSERSVLFVDAVKVGHVVSVIAIW
jgi:hypothetical protein